MAKKLSDIEKIIWNKEKHFILHLEKLLDKNVFNFLIKLSELGSLYLFSGIIRNYFLDVREVRDVDIMIDTSKDISRFINNFEHRKNSYGGYKIFINETTIDLWYLQDTWALHNSQKVLEFELEKHIPHTAFFNFSSILYSFTENKFIYTKYFLRFLRDKKIDYVFEPNANYALCVVNSFYYQDKLRLSLTDKLKKYLVKLNDRYSFEYDNVQLKHFGKILYSKKDIQLKIENIITSKTSNSGKTMTMDDLKKT